MKFGLMVDLCRTGPEESVQKKLSETTELVRMADQGGFDILVCGEHHGHEMTIAPNPFDLLSYWADKTTQIRLGTAVVCAPYWHPLRLAGEAGLVDVLTDGRLDLGIGRGAYPYEFARMANGITPEVARTSLGEILPAIKGLWEGDYTHEGKWWSFPSTTSTPRPVQAGGPPIWVSARHPEVFRIACENRCNVMVAPLDKPFSEVVSLRERLDAAVTDAKNGWSPKMMVLRDACIHNSRDPLMPAKYGAERSDQFKSLFDTEGHVEQGFVLADANGEKGHSIKDLEEATENNLFGTADQVIEDLKCYEEAGTDIFLYGTGWGLPHEIEKKSIQSFIEKVIPSFNKT